MIRTTNHTLKFSRKGKMNKLQEFITEYRRVSQIYLDYLWNNEYTWEVKSKIHTFNIQENLLDHPKMLSNVDLENKLQDFNSILSARAKKCCLTQICGIIGSSVEKQRKRIYQYNKTPNHLLLKKIEQNKPVKPDISNLNPELNSICIDWEETNNNFNGFIQLKSIGKEFDKIRLPIKFHRRNKKYKTWDLKTSFLLNEHWVNFRWEKKVEKKQEGIIVGVDQGKKDVVTFSNGITPPKINYHGKSLDSIMLSLSKCRKGSKRFGKKQVERKNFINWSINKLNFNNIKQVNLEKIWNIGYKNKISRLMSHWTNTLIRDKLKNKCEELGVQVVEQSCTYRSQRCSSCGLVRKSHRKGKIYFCKDCGLKIAA